jgi:hypothetical protein
MELNAKQQKCAAALILLTAMSRNDDLKETAKIFGKHTLNYSNLNNHKLLTEMEPELGELFEAYLNNIKTTYMEQSVSNINSMDFDLLQDVNEAVERAILQYNCSREMFNLSSFRNTIQQICDHIKYVRMGDF